MSIFTFMGASVVRQDDSYSFEVITKTLDTVIPALIQVGVVCLNCIYFQLCIWREIWVRNVLFVKAFQSSVLKRKQITTAKYDKGGECHREYFGIQI